MATPILELRDVKTHFPISHGFIFKRDAGTVKAVDGVTLSVGQGEVLGLVGESGCGKSTLARTIMQLVPTTAGTVVLEGKNLTGGSREDVLAARRHLQMVFQDPYASLNPRMTVFDTLAEPLFVHAVCPREQVPARVAELMQLVGLAPRYRQKYPHEFSGGQRQRIAIARALAVGPRFLVADEPVSALDVSVQAGILALMRELQDGLGLAMLFISHDLGVVEVMADRVMVLYLGRVMEVAPTRAIYTTPRHPYSAGLLAAAPLLAGRERPAVQLRDEIPSPADPPSGCVFRTRCPFALPRCAEETPPLRPVGEGRQMACLRDDLVF
jgi:oligopeptide/dipeptide ABC transporter ATP-binding protein